MKPIIIASPHVFLAKTDVVTVRSGDNKGYSDRYYSLVSLYETF